MIWVLIGHQCFKEAEREAHRLLMQNAWPSFRDSVQFTMCAVIIRGLIPPPDRPRGGPSIHWQAVNASSDLSDDSGSVLTDTQSRQSSAPNRDTDDDDVKHETATATGNGTTAAIAMDVVRSYEPVTSTPITPYNHSHY